MEVVSTGGSMSGPSKFLIRSNFSPARIKALRLRLGAGQAVFARLMGVSRGLVQSWEQGVRQPSLLARRLLEEMQNDPRRWQRMIRRAA